MSDVTARRWVAVIAGLFVAVPACARGAPVDETMRLPARPPCAAFADARLLYDDVRTDELEVQLDGFGAPLKLSRRGRLPLPPGPWPKSVRFRVLRPTSVGGRILVELACPTPPSRIEVEHGYVGVKTTVSFPAGAFRTSAGAFAASWAEPGAEPTRRPLTALYEIARDAGRGHPAGVVGAPPEQLTPSLLALARALLGDVDRLVRGACVEDRCTDAPREAARRALALASGPVAIASLVADDLQIRFDLKSAAQDAEVRCTYPGRWGCELTLSAKPPFTGARYETDAEATHAALNLGGHGLGGLSADGSVKAGDTNLVDGIATIYISDAAMR